MKTDLPALLSLIDLFYGKDFTLEKAEALFGPVAADKGDSIELSPPKGSNAASVTLEKFFVKPDEPLFLAGICFTFKEPPLVDFAAFALRYGPEVELPRLKPRQDVPYRLQIPGTDYSGYMLCLARPDAQGPLRTVNKLVLRRFPGE